MSSTLDQINEEIAVQMADFKEEATWEGSRFAVAILLARAQECPEYGQDKALRERVRELVEAWSV